jgi:hypothetical protein
MYLLFFDELLCDHLESCEWFLLPGNQGGNLSGVIKTLPGKKGSFHSISESTVPPMTFAVPHSVTIS